MITRRSMLTALAALTGSAAFGVATSKSDEDYLISPADASQLGVNVDEDMLHDPAYPMTFRSYRDGNINLIIYGSEEFRDKWMKAHRHCLIERPKDKARRVQIFKHYMEGGLLH